MVARVRCSWQNWPGAPGVSTFYGDDDITQATVDSIRTFFQALVTLLPTGLTINVPSSGDIIDQSSGTLTGVWSVGSTPATVTGAGAGAYAGNAGAVVHWLTDAIVAGRRTRGRTFLVPLVGSAFDTSGSLSTTAHTAITNAAAALVSANPGLLNVWRRPKPGFSGGNASITSSRVPDLAISLRSRRI